MPNTDPKRPFCSHRPILTLCLISITLICTMGAFYTFTFAYCPCLTAPLARTLEPAEKVHEEEPTEPVIEKAVPPKKKE